MIYEKKRLHRDSVNHVRIRFCQLYSFNLINTVLILFYSLTVNAQSHSFFIICRQSALIDTIYSKIRNESLI